VPNVFSAWFFFGNGEEHEKKKKAKKKAFGNIRIQTEPAWDSALQKRVLHQSEIGGRGHIHWGFSVGIRWPEVNATPNSQWLMRAGLKKSFVTIIIPKPQTSTNVGDRNPKILSVGWYKQKNSSKSEK